MLKFLKRLYILTIMLAASWPVASSAAEISDFEFEKRFVTPQTGLELKGVGLLRYLGFFKAYAGAFYLEEGIGIEQALADRAKRLEVEYLRAFEGEDIARATMAMIEKNADNQTIERIRQQIEYHNSLYVDVQPGDRYALTYVPGIGTELSLNGEPRGVIDGAEFASVLFSVWIGQNPIDKGFKRQILGI
jgi:hypothetical protein